MIGDVLLQLGRFYREALGDTALSFGRDVGHANPPGAAFQVVLSEIGRGALPVPSNGQDLDLHRRSFRRCLGLIRLT